MATNANGIEVATYDPRKVNLILNGKLYHRRRCYHHPE